MFRWFKTLFNIVKYISQLESQVIQQKDENTELKRQVGTLRHNHFKIREAFEELKDPITHADIGHRNDSSTIIVLGRYRGKDYVEIQVVPPSEFEYTVERLRDIKKRDGRLGRIDAPYHFKGWI